MAEKLTKFTFDASTVKPSAPMEALPKGWQNMEITDVYMEATKGRNAGKRAVFQFTVMDGELKGRKMTSGINVVNASAQAQDIGQRDMSAICHATGVIRVEDLSEFLGKCLQVKVGFGKDEYADKNEAKGYKALEGASLPASAPVGIPSGPPPIAAATPPPITAPVAPPVAASAPVVAFPPQGWIAHPTSPGYYYQGQEVLTEADLRARVAPVAAPVIPAAPVAPAAPTPPPVAAPVIPAAPVAPAAPTPPPVAAPAPVQWLPHPTAPGWVYNAANPEEMMQADIAGVPATPAAADSSVPPWKR